MRVILNICVFRRKLSKLREKDTIKFACDKFYIFPETRANKGKQWTHFSALKQVNIQRG